MGTLVGGIRGIMVIFGGVLINEGNVCFGYAEIFCVNKKSNGGLGFRMLVEFNEALLLNKDDESLKIQGLFQLRSLKLDAFLL